MRPQTPSSPNPQFSGCVWVFFISPLWRKCGCQISKKDNKGLLGAWTKRGNMGVKYSVWTSHFAWKLWRSHLLDFCNVGNFIYWRKLDKHICAGLNIEVGIRSEMSVRSVCAFAFHLFDNRVGVKYRRQIIKSCWQPGQNGRVWRSSIRLKEHTTHVQ